jgi:hypothetical protein
MSFKKGRCCPIIDGSRDKRLDGLAKLSEVCVILVALFVLQEVRSTVIPWGCPLSAKTNCIQGQKRTTKKKSICLVLERETNEISSQNCFK